MIRLSKLTDYAVVLLLYMTQEGAGTLLSSARLAALTRIPEPTVSKILKILARHDIVHSVRGMRGGYMINKGIGQIRIVDVVEAVEGEIAVTDCVADSHDCVIRNHCAGRGRWDAVNDAVKNALAGITLADMAGGEDRNSRAVKAAL